MLKLLVQDEEEEDEEKVKGGFNVIETLWVPPFYFTDGRYLFACIQV